LHKTIGLPEASMRREHLLNASSYIVKRSVHKLDDRFYGRSAIAAMRLMDMLGHKTRPSLQIVAAAAGAALKGPEVAALALQALLGRARKQVGYSLRLQLESAPNPESRVVLSRKEDALGMPRLDLNWKTTQQDAESYRRCEELIHAGLSSMGFRLRKFEHELSPDGWPVSMIAGKHHMGTTRMDTDPHRGVVDENCKLHEVRNLFVASASVFPTGGMANPTLTIVALAVRLADHIKGRWGM
jgi:choline dehydrogenase-like flavoprotein